MSPDHTYKYFLLGDTIPARVIFNERGHKLGAEVPNAATKELEINFDVLGRLEQSPEVDEIDQARFEQLCQGVYSKKKSNFGLGNP